MFLNPCGRAFRTILLLTVRTHQKHLSTITFALSYQTAHISDIQNPSGSHGRPQLLPSPLTPKQMSKYSQMLEQTSETLQ